jgi:hypothetical protein
MANRIPLVFDPTTSKIKELPSGDNLNLANSSIVDAINIGATGTLTANTVSVTNLNVGGSAIAEVAKTNDYNDLDNLPSLFSGDYNDLTNKPSAISADWADITNKPVIATKLSQLTNDTNFVTNAQVNITPIQVSGIAEVAKTNDYNDLDNRITAVSQLTNDANYVTAEDVAGGTLTVEVNNTGNLVGSVFGDDSSVLVDHLNSTINLSNGPVSGSVDVGSTSNRFGDVYLGSIIDIDGSEIGSGAQQTVAVSSLTLNPTGNKRDEMAAQLEQYQTAYDDAYNAWLSINPGPEKDAFYTNTVLPALTTLNEYADFITNAKTILYYEPETDAITSVTPFEGTFKGSVIGSVFADDSTVLVDGIDGTHYGKFDGDLTGSVFADDSTLIVDGLNNSVNATNVYATTHWGDLSKNGSILSVTANSGIQLLPNGVFNIPNATTIDIDATSTIDITATGNLTLSSTAGSISIDGFISLAELKTALQDGIGDFAAFKAYILGL